MGQWEVGHEVDGVVVNPLADGASTALAAEQGGTDQREQHIPAVTFSARFAGVGDIDNGVHQAAILGFVHHVPSF